MKVEGTTNTGTEVQVATESLDAELTAAFVAALTVANRPPPEPAVFRKHTFRSCPLSEKPRSSKSSTPRMDLRYGL